VGCGALVGKGR